MNKKYLMVAIVYILVFATTVFSVSQLKEQAQPATIHTAALPQIIIDAGHGGMDGGASAADGTVEKHINLDISKKLECLFQVLGFDVIMTRTEDVLEAGEETNRSLKVNDIRRRLAIAEQHPQAIFLSIHQNKFSVPKYKGTQVFYAPNGEKSEALAKSIQNSVASLLQKDNYRQIKKTGKEIYILYHTTITAVMVECGFLSNPEECELLKSAEYQDKMAFSILCGTMEYCESL